MNPLLASFILVALAVLALVGMYCIVGAVESAPGWAILLGWLVWTKVGK